MTTKELYLKLKQAYTIDNLNSISLTLIDLYKNQQFTVLRKIAELLSDWAFIEIQGNGKGFSKFMMLYHPDRCTFHNNVIERFASKNDYTGLLSYSHILYLNKIEEIANSLNSFEDVDYSPVYEWDFNANGFTVFNDFEPKEKERTELKEFDFYDAVKIRFFDNTEMEYPSWYLEDLEEIELSSSTINDLEGAEFCIHTKNMDLSDNLISDLTPLSGLSFLEQLNLSDNQIECIDTLSNLLNLRTLNLANNNINDIRPLFELGNLEYIDLSGNKIPDEQMAELRKLQITVDL